LIAIFKDFCLIFELKSIKEGDSTKDLEINDQELIHGQEQLDSIKTIIESHSTKMKDLFKTKNLGDLTRYQIVYLVLFENFLGTEHIEQRYLVLSKIHIHALVDQAEGNPRQFIDALINYPKLPRASIIDRYNEFKIGRFIIRIPLAEYDQVDEFEHVKPPHSLA
jgi:hypothetical protein